MTNIANELIAIAIKIGRWVLERVLKRGAVRLGHYLLERAEALRQKLKRAKTARKKRWLRGKIKRRERAGGWLLAWASDVSKCVAEEAEQLALHGAKLPLVANCEKYRRAA